MIEILELFEIFLYTTFILYKRSILFFIHVYIFFSLICKFSFATDSRISTITNNDIGISTENKTDLSNKPKDFNKNEELKYIPGEIIVKYKEDKINLNNENGLSKLEEVKNKFLLESKEQLKKRNIEVFKTKNSVEDTIKKLIKDENIEYAEPNYIRRLAVINTNDTYKDYLWGLDNIGQSVNGTIGTVDNDIDAPAAWGLSEGDGVIVAVIDSGVAYNHPDLINNLWDGSNCKDENGNFLGGCLHGYDFENNDKVPLPDISSHGTHVAGIIAAEKNNSKGIIGVAPKAKIMALKSVLITSEIIKAIDFAIQNGAKVINASYGDNYYSQLEYDAINRFRSAGGVFVAAAGNDSRNNDAGIPFYPSNYDLDNIISVAATDQYDNIASFSNYGLVSVDVGAPGTNIYSTVPSETVVLNETFDDLLVPNIPINWVKYGINNNWGSYNLGGSWGKVLYGDLNYPYLNNIDTNVTSQMFNLNEKGTNISFWTGCDTEYRTDGWYDYMILELSNDGINFEEYLKWDEATLDYLNSDTDQSGSATYHFQNYSIPSLYETSNFRFRFRWVTNSLDNNYDGCIIDDVVLTTLSNGSDEKYGYMHGTSMAAPHVSGEVAILNSKYPLLTNTEIKDLIIKSADITPSLIGKIFSNKRLNMLNACFYQDTYSSASVYRFWNLIDGDHFYTMNETEMIDIISNLSDFWKYEGVSYIAHNSSTVNTIPLYRFWNLQNGQHFYTTSFVEKEWLMATYPTIWHYENISYYVYPPESTALVSNVYRFWNLQNGQHFYTTSFVEKEWLMATYPTIWHYEGVAYKVL